MDKSVPSVVGMTVEQAQDAAARQGLGYRVIGEGTEVTYQLPEANSVVAAQSQMIFYCGAEPSAETEEMPDLTGLTYSIARQRLGYYGLFIKTNSNRIADSDTIVVSKQSIESGEQVEHGTVVEVTLVDTDASVYGRY